MQATTLTLETPNGVSFFVHRWLLEKPVKTVVRIIAHGWAEHAGRHGRLAQGLCGEGYAVYAAAILLQHRGEPGDGGARGEWRPRALVEDAEQYEVTVRGQRGDGQHSIDVAAPRHVDEPTTTTKLGSTGRVATPRAMASITFSAV